MCSDTGKKIKEGRKKQKTLAEVIGGDFSEKQKWVSLKHNIEKNEQ